MYSHKLYYEVVGIRILRIFVRAQNFDFYIEYLALFIKTLKKLQKIRKDKKEEKKNLFDILFAIVPKVAYY